MQVCAYVICIVLELCLYIGDVIGSTGTLIDVLLVNMPVVND